MQVTHGVKVPLKVIGGSLCMTYAAFDTFSQPLRSGGDKLARWQDSLVSVRLSRVQFED